MRDKIEQALKDVSLVKWGQLKDVCAHSTTMMHKRTRHWHEWCSEIDGRCCRLACPIWKQWQGEDV